MILFAGLFARFILGVVLGVVGGIIGYFTAWLLLPPTLGLAQTLAVLTTSVGIAGGIGGFLAWIDPESGVRTILLRFGLAILGGIIGSWAMGLFEYWTAERASPLRPVRTASILLAGTGAGLLPMLLSAWLTGRQHAR